MKSENRNKTKLNIYQIGNAIMPYTLSIVCLMLSILFVLLPTITWVEYDKSDPKTNVTWLLLAWILLMVNIAWVFLTLQLYKKKED
jgi:hypothetical protein